MKSINSTLAVILIAGASLIAYNIGLANGLSNQTPTYGSTGSPKNCRAVIATNITGYELGIYTAEGALNSINRNCGLEGYSWNER